MPDSAQDSLTPSPPEIILTRWHRAMLAYLKEEESELWTWFTSHKVRNDNADAVRLDLLKTAYRIDRESATDLYGTADDVATKMNLTSPVTLYQAQQATGLNAGLAWLPDEAHIILQGPLQDTLSAEEMAAVFAHELAHHELFTANSGDYLAMEQVFSAMTTDQAAAAPHDRTWRTHQLYTELYCDRRAAMVTQNVDSCICALVKIATGLKDVSAAAYRQQADEVLAGGIKASDGITHPEMFIRAKALALWEDNPDTVDELLEAFVEGPLELKQLDLLRQAKMTTLTERFLQAFLSTKWLQTDLLLSHARRFGESFRVQNLSDTDVTQLQRELEQCDTELRNYFCYVLLDLVTFDPQLEEAPLAAAFAFTEKTGLKAEFRSIAEKELKLGKRAFQKVETDATEIMQKAAQEFSTPQP